MPRVFVDRDVETAQLAEFLHQVASDGPRVLVVHGVAGVGKTSLLTAFAQRVRSVTSLRLGAIASVRCHGQVGAENAYGVMVDAVKGLQPRKQRGRLLKLGRRVAVDSGTELLASLVPAAGPALRAGVAAAEAQSGADTAVAIPMPTMIADAILDSIRPKRPSILLIDDAHLIDASSCLVLDRLLTPSVDRPLAIVLAMRSGELAPDSPLQELLDRLAIQETALSIPLGGFSPDAVESFVRERYGIGLEADRTSELHRHTGGHPIFVAQYLSMLRERSQTTGTGEDFSFAPGAEGLPSSAEVVIRQRINRLDPSDLELLALAAVQGERFITATVERLSGRPRRDVLDRLYQVSIENGLIQLCDVDEWAQRAGADVYEFEHALVRQVLYTKQSPQLRRERHSAMAAVLDELIRDWTTKPRTYLLEVIRHHHLGGEFLPAARNALAMARSLIASGGSVAEAEQLCRQALDDVRQVDAGGEADRLRVELIELLLLATESRWSTSPTYLESTPLEPLTEEAGIAADRCGDLRLRVRAAALRGRVLHKVRGVDESLVALSEAVRLAEETGDPTMRFLTRSAYGRELTKRELHNGLGVLFEAEQMVREHGLDRTDEPAVLHAVARTEMQIGVSMFDSGDLGAAEARLTSCVTRLRRGGDAGTMPTALNYLAQVQCAVGQWERARATLTEAVALGEAEPSAWHAYNLAMLGKLYLDLDEAGPALDALAAAWDETRRTRLINVASLVCNLYVEGLLHTMSPDGAEAADVREMLTSNVDQSRRAGLRRSEVVGLSLLSKLWLRRGEVAAAVEASEQAVQLLDDHGPLPAVRDEEILHQHSVVLDRAGRGAEADQARVRARQVVDDKAATLNDELRQCFLTRVALNVELVESTERSGYSAQREITRDG